MRHTYIDIHIHTSDNADELNENYDVAKLHEKVKSVAGDSPVLISLTDHNVVNEAAYLKAIDYFDNILIGCELHIRYREGADPYHCHILFDVDKITSQSISGINEILHKLYPKKIVSKDCVIPKIDDIVHEFESYDFLLLPHGGQSYKTFDGAIPEGVSFDGTMERSVYYNTFDGFTARSNKGLERTIKYFKRLGINEFINLVTCTDNYNPERYPEGKDPNAAPFKPTWMHALPTFEGLRLSLSESSRLTHQDECPPDWSEYIKSAKLKSENIDIDVDFTQGLNVVIGGSSSGKTLLVDSVYRKIDGDFTDSDYKGSPYFVENIAVDHPTKQTPHYINQNYIIKVIGSEGKGSSIGKIDIIRKLFPDDYNVEKENTKILNKFRDNLKQLLTAIMNVEEVYKNLEHISALSHLILVDEIKKNLFDLIMPDRKKTDLIRLDDSKHVDYVEYLDDIDEFLKKNPIISHNESLTKELKSELESAKHFSDFEELAQGIIKASRDHRREDLKEENKIGQEKRAEFERLLKCAQDYKSSLYKFKHYIKLLSETHATMKTFEVESMGHKLYIENNFTINTKEIMDVLNKFRTAKSQIDKFDDICPEDLFLSKFNQTLKMDSYDKLEKKVYSEFENMNKKLYKITTNDQRDFDSLSAGWKTSVLLDLILGYEKDLSPIIIDQPEDNLATQYINNGLVEAIWCMNIIIISIVLLRYFKQQKPIFHCQ